MTDSSGVLSPIGVIHTPYERREDTPVQSSLNRDVTGRVEIELAYRDALDGLSGFSHAWLLTWLGDPGFAAPAVPPALRQVPFLLGAEGRAMGIFAMRGPRRPSPIGLSLVRIVAVTEDGLTFAGVDMVEGTPLLDLKPYVTAFDRPDGEVRCGWFDETDLPTGATPTSLRDQPER